MLKKDTRMWLIWWVIFIKVLVWFQKPLAILELQFYVLSLVFESDFVMRKRSIRVLVCACNVYFLELFAFSPLSSVRLHLVIFALSSRAASSLFPSISSFFFARVLSSCSLKILSPLRSALSLSLSLSLAMRLLHLLFLYFIKSLYRQKDDETNVST